MAQDAFAKDALAKTELVWVENNTVYAGHSIDNALHIL